MTLDFMDKDMNTRLAQLRKDEEEKLMQALAPQYGLSYVNLHGYTLNPEALSFITEAEARAANVVAFDHKQNTLSVGMKSPNDAKTLKLLGEIEKNKRVTIIPFLCSTESLEHGWKRYADVVNSTTKVTGVFDINPEDILRFTERIKSKEDVLSKLNEVGGINNARRVTETLELVFAGAIALRSSDIHIEPEEHVVRLRYRLDGILYDIFDIDRYIYERLMSRLKLLSGMTLNQKLQAQDGRFTFNTGDRMVEVRASVIPGAAGESIVMRILDPSVASFSFETLDLNPALRTALELELKKPNGLIITTGPTGSGKTTALYALLRATYSEGVKIITIENPVEYKLEGIVQTQTGDDYTFAAGLRAVLRQDPDVIMVGEIRDKEVAETAIHAAQTGHLVFSTLHTNSAVGGFPRLIDLGIEARTLGSAINAFLGQRLLRRLCTCKESYPASEREAKLLSQIMRQHPQPETISTPVTLYKAKGCERCGKTGYKGRMGIFEAILMDTAVEEVVIRDPREHLILAAAKPQGIPTMIEDGVVKVLRGDTTLDELERVVELPKLEIESKPEEINKSDNYNLEIAPGPEKTLTEEDIFLRHIV